MPDSGVIAKVNVQGNRRVESDAIRAAIPLKAGDTFDREKVKAALLATATEDTGRETTRLKPRDAAAGRKTTRKTS